MFLKSVSKIEVLSLSIFCSYVNVYVSVWFVWVRKEKQQQMVRRKQINLTLYTDYTI